MPNGQNSCGHLTVVVNFIRRVLLIGPLSRQKYR